MGMFGKPKQPDYAKIQEDARLAEEERAAQEKQISEQAQLEAVTAAENKRKAFYQGLETVDQEEQNKRFLKAV